MLINSANAEQSFPNFCVSLLPEISAHRSALASVLCGAKVSDPEILIRLRQTALLHLFVVSGAHLIEMERLLAWCRIPKWLRLTMAIGFTLLTGAQPPLVRAMTGLLLPERISEFFSRWKSHARPDSDVLKVGILTLAMVPVWIQSLSLALSWVCAFSISLPLGSGWRGAFRKTMAVWLFLLPLLFPWGIASPISWILNLVVAPIFAAVSLPLALLALIGGIFVQPFDRFMDIFLWLVDQLSDPTAPVSLGHPPPAWLWWLWIGALHIGAHVFFVSNRRNQCASSSS